LHDFFGERVRILALLPTVSKAARRMTLIALRQVFLYRKTPALPDSSLCYPSAAHAKARPKLSGLLSFAFIPHRT
jgi:hypothetical protein